MKLKRGGILAAIVIAVMVVVYLILNSLIDPEHLRPQLEARLSSALARNVHIGALELALLSGGVTARDVSISEDPAFSAAGASAPFIHTDSLSVKVVLTALIFHHDLTITGINIAKPDVRLIETADGRWNYSSLGGATPGSPASASEGNSTSVQINLFDLTDGRLSVTLPGKPSPLVLDKVNIEMKHVSTTTKMPFTLSANFADGSTLQLSGTAGPLGQSGADAMPLQAEIHATRVNLVKSGLVEPEANIGGLATLDASIMSEGDLADVKGKLKADQIVLAKNGRPAAKQVGADFEVRNHRSQQKGELVESGIHVGSAEVSLSGNYDLHGRNPLIHMSASGTNLPLTEFAALLPAMDVVLPAHASIDGGTATLKASLDGSLDVLTVSGSVSLDNTRLKNFDLASKMQALGSLAGLKASPDTEIQTLSAAFQSSNQGTRMDNIHLVVPSIGELAGAGTVSPSHALDFKMRANVSQMALVGQMTRGLGAIPFSITGTSDNPVFRPDVKSMVTDRLQNLTGGTGGVKGLLGGFLGKKP